MSSRYISALATAGAKTGTISRRLSTIKFAHKVRNVPDPTQTARITAVWEGIRRSLGTSLDQARPLIPSLLLDSPRRLPRDDVVEDPHR